MITEKEWDKTKIFKQLWEIIEINMSIDKNAKMSIINIENKYSDLQKVYERSIKLIGDGSNILHQNIQMSYDDKVNYLKQRRILKIKEKDPLYFFKWPLPKSIDIEDEFVEFFNKTFDEFMTEENNIKFNLKKVC